MLILPSSFSIDTDVDCRQSAKCPGGCGGSCPRRIEDWVVPPEELLYVKEAGQRLAVALDICSVEESKNNNHKTKLAVCDPVIILPIPFCHVVGRLHQQELELKKDKIENQLLTCTWCPTQCRGRRALMLHEQVKCQQRIVPCPVVLQLGVSGCDGWKLPADPQRHELFTRHLNHQSSCQKYIEARESGCPSCLSNNRERSRSDYSFVNQWQAHAKVCKALIPCVGCSFPTPLFQVPRYIYLYVSLSLLPLLLMRLGVDRYSMTNMNKYTRN